MRIEKSTIVGVTALAALAFGVSGLVGLGPGGGPAAGSSPSDLVFSSETIDLGDELRQSRKYRGRLQLTNARAETIHIEYFETDCGCTAVLSDDKHLAPGETTWVDASLDTGSNRGEFARRCTVLYRRESERKRRKAKFVIRGTVIPEFEVSRRVLDFDRTEPGREKVVFTPNGGAKLDLRVLGVSAHGLAATSQASGSGGSHQIEVTFDPESYRGGQGRARIVVATGNQVQPEFSIDVVIR